MDQIIRYAPLLASTVATAAFLSGLWQFRRTQRLTREVKAVELFLKFNELNQQLAQLSEVDHQANFWKHNALLAMTEAVFKLTVGERPWRETVAWMLEAQRWFLTQNPINCATFSGKFVKAMKQAVPQLQCV